MQTEFSPIHSNSYMQNLPSPLQPTLSHSAEPQPQDPEPLPPLPSRPESPPVYFQTKIPPPVAFSKMNDPAKRHSQLAYNSTIPTLPLSLPAIPFLMKTICFYLPEYIIILLIELAIVFSFHRFHVDFSSWAVGVCLALLEVILTGMCLLVVKKKLGRWTLPLQIFDSLAYAAAMGWASVVLDFSFISTSYMMVLNLVLLLVFIRYTGTITFWISLIVFALLLINTIILSLVVSSWYYALPIMIFLVLQLSIVDLEFKNVLIRLQTEGSWPPGNLTFAVRLRFWVVWVDLGQTPLAKGSEAMIMCPPQNFFSSPTPK